MKKTDKYSIEIKGITNKEDRDIIVSILFKSLENKVVTVQKKEKENKITLNLIEDDNL